MPLEIQFITAPWCKRCQTIKADFIEHCRMLGVTPEWIDFDTLDDESELKKSVEALPTMKVRNDPKGGWEIFTAKTFPDWRERTTELSLKEGVVTDF